MNRSKAIIQTYIDGKTYSLPIDARLSYKHPEIGWEPDEYTLDNGVELDKQMRNRGWMKGADSYNSNYIPSRSSGRELRKIITRIQLSEGDHWIRFRNLNDTERKEFFDFDYIELVPLNVINDPLKPEDRH